MKDRSLSKAWGQGQSPGANDVSYFPFDELVEALVLALSHAPGGTRMWTRTVAPAEALCGLYCAFSQAKEALRSLDGGLAQR